jgi:hypothetical protein
MAQPPQTAGPEEKVAVAAYVASLSGDLSVMARQTGLNALGFLLEMARLEAEQVSRGPQGRNGRS